MTPGADSLHPRRIQLWLDMRAIPLNKRLPYLTAMRAVGAQAVVVEKGDGHLERQDLQAMAIDGKGRIKQGKQVVGALVAVRDAKAQAKAAAIEGVVVVEETKDRIIPLENLAAARQDRPGTLFARATSTQEAARLAGILEHGVHGILLAPSSPHDILEVAAVLKAPDVPGPYPSRNLAPAGVETSLGRSASPAAPLPPSSVVVPSAVSGSPALPLSPARITAITDGGLGDRVCVDTTSLLADGEGLLVGSTAHSLALVLAETAPSAFVASRPFRVNAGALHSYTMTPSGQTRYLAELGAGAEVTVTGPGGERAVTVGRVKLERRPHRIVHWQARRGAASVVLQLAETVRLARPDGGGLPITEAQVGDEILVHDGAPAGRHAGVAVDETVEER